MTDLKPCPFCGGPATREIKTPPRSVTIYETGCNNVGRRVLPSSGINFSKKASDKAWNTRAIDLDAFGRECVKEGLRMGADKAAIHNLGRNKARGDRQVASILNQSPEALTAAVERVKGGAA